MSLETPERIRSLQRKLYCKAKAEPAFRFYVLYDKICRADILAHAYALARDNGGAPGVDGVTFSAIEASGLETCRAIKNQLLRPPAEALEVRVPVAEPVRQVSPGTTRSRDIQHSFHEPAIVAARAPGIANLARKRWSDTLPLLVPQHIAIHDADSLFQL